jgi:Cofactor assembly of complex C subunit B, CCB2/CCB4
VSCAAGRFELLAYLPQNTQSAIIQPIGDRGVMVIGGPYQRGFSTLDQAWIATLCDKLDALLSADTL